MENNDFKRVVVTENNSQTSMDSQIEQTFSNSHPYTKEYVNNLLLDAIHSLDSMRNIIHNFEMQNVQLNNQYLKDVDSEEMKKYKDIIQISTNQQQLQKKSIEFKNLITSNNGFEKQEKINSETHKQPYIEKNKKTITDELSLLIKLIKSIIQKLDDPNYECENESCQLLRDRQKLKTTDITENYKNEYIKNIINEQQINLNESNKIINNENDKKNMPIDKQKHRSMIKILKFDPKCKENQSICTCSPIEEFYRRKNCSYINYDGRILILSCPNDS